MKHSREWCTCDRCGEELLETGLFRNFLPRRHTRTTCMDVEKVEKVEYISDIIEKPEINTCTIRFCTGYRTVNKEIHLCGECRKDFDEFMKGCGSTYDKKPICKE